MAALAHRSKWLNPVRCGEPVLGNGEPQDPAPSHHSCVTNSCLWSRKKSFTEVQRTAPQAIQCLQVFQEIARPRPRYILMFFLDLTVKWRRAWTGRNWKQGGLSQQTKFLWDKTRPFFWSMTFSHTYSIPGESTTCWEGHWGEGKNEPADPGWPSIQAWPLGLLKEITERKIKNSNMWAQQIWQLHHIIPFLKILIHFCWPIPHLRNVLNPGKLCSVFIL